MFCLLLIASKLSSLRAPGSAILVALLLSETILNTSGAIFTREIYSENQNLVASAHFFEDDRRIPQTTVIMKPGSGKGVFSSGLNTNRRVYMGNVPQVLHSGREDTHFIETITDAHFYEFSSAGPDFTVKHDGRTLLRLVMLLDKEDQGENRMLDAGEHGPPSNLVPRWFAVIPSDTGVQSVHIKIYHHNGGVEDMTFEVKDERALLKASELTKFELMDYVLKPDKTHPEPRRIQVSTTTKPGKTYPKARRIEIRALPGPAKRPRFTFRLAQAEA
ncbi:hypothetical protein PCANC_11226 [Puccinia coronata f. sp. avenae]|uniref:Uncharacterized protein n=1 Tax=Puccinia coronata f. sp. avenae TaxID=200324 RepID=A0A2N5V8M0_9BASI|nr:hypothetical protein PCANC_11226 [Puccinia coronata f. sp. avenae]